MSEKKKKIERPEAPWNVMAEKPSGFAVPNLEEVKAAEKKEELPPPPSFPTPGTVGTAPGMAVGYANPYGVKGNISSGYAYGGQINAKKTPSAAEILEAVRLPLIVEFHHVKTGPTGEEWLKIIAMMISKAMEL